MKWIYSTMCHFIYLNGFFSPKNYNCTRNSCEDYSWYATLKKANCRRRASGTLWATSRKCVEKQNFCCHSDIECLVRVNCWHSFWEETNMLHLTSKLKSITIQEEIHEKIHEYYNSGANSGENPRENVFFCGFVNIACFFCGTDMQMNRNILSQ